MAEAIGDPQQMEARFTASIRKDGAFATYLELSGSEEILGTDERSRSPGPSMDTTSPPP